MKRWVVEFVDACLCCTYRFKYGTRREARSAARRFKMPVRDYWGRPTTLRRAVRPVRRIG